MSEKAEKACARRRRVALGRGGAGIFEAPCSERESPARGQRVSARLAGWKAELE